MVKMETIDKVINLKGEWSVVFDYDEIAYATEDTSEVRRCNPALSTGWGNLPASLQGVIEVYKKGGAYVVHLYNTYNAHGDNYYMVEGGKLFYVFEEEDDYGHYCPNFEDVMEQATSDYLSVPYWEEGSIAKLYLEELLNNLIIHTA